MNIRCIVFRRRWSSRHQGFSLLEMLVVVAILAIVGGSLVLSYSGVQDSAQEQIALSEMQELKKGILRFRTDTGYLPWQGPFQHVDQGGYVTEAALFGEAQGDSQQWFYSPANFWLLTGRYAPEQSPLHLSIAVTGTPHVLETFHAETGRGWNGPYLTQPGNAETHVRADSEQPPVIGSGLLPDGTGDPLSGTELGGLRKLIDPWGQPYLFFIDTPASNPALGPRLVSMGPNGIYEGINGSLEGDDITLEILK